MDITSLTRDTFSAWVPFADGVDVKVRHMTRERLRDIYRTATTVKLVNREKKEEFDAVLADVLLGREAVEDWKGFSANGAPFPCTPDNVEILIRRHKDFASFVNDTCTDLETLMQREKDEAEKN